MSLPEHSAQNAGCHSTLSGYPGHNQGANTETRVSFGGTLLKNICPLEWHFSLEKIKNTCPLEKTFPLLEYVCSAALHTHWKQTYRQCTYISQSTATMFCAKALHKTHIDAWQSILFAGYFPMHLQCI